MSAVVCNGIKTGHNRDCIELNAITEGLFEFKLCPWPLDDSVNIILIEFEYRLLLLVDHRVNTVVEPLVQAMEILAGDVMAWTTDLGSVWTIPAPCIK